MVDCLVFRSKTATQTQKSVFIVLVIGLIVISFLSTIFQLYRSRFLKIRKKFFPAQLSHFDEESRKIHAYFTPDNEFLSAFQSENIINSNTKIRVQWNENISKIPTQAIAAEMPSEYIEMIHRRTSAPSAGNETNRISTSAGPAFKSSKSSGYTSTN
jgi:hypothetical protein